MPNSFKEYLSNIEALLLDAYEIDSMVHLKLLCGIYYLLDRHDQKAFRLLSEAHLSAKESSFDHFTYRSSIFLALYYLAHQKPKLALSKLREAKRSYSGSSNDVDIEILDFCEAACYIAQGDNSQLEELIQSLPSSSHIRFRIEEVLDRVNHSAQLDVTSFQTKLFEHLQKMLRLGKKQTYKITTSQKTESISADRLNSIQTSSYDIVVNEVTGKIRIGKKLISCNKKGLLLKLFIYLLKSEGRFVSKEEMCLRVWHENYNPIVHDQRIYTAIRRLRDLLRSPKAILSRDGTYCVPSRFKYIIFSEEDSSRLNDRLAWILQFVETNGSSSRFTIQSALKISPSSCKADLRLLLEDGKLEAFGRGRNTRYRRPHA